MNRTHFDQIIDNYAARFVELNTGDNNEVYKWEIAAEFRPMMDAALAADDRDFPAKLAAVVLLTKQRSSLFMRWLIMHGGSFRQHAKYATPFTNCLPPTAETWRSERSALQSFLISASPCGPDTARTAGGIERVYAYP